MFKALRLFWLGFIVAIGVSFVLNLSALNLCSQSLKSSQSKSEFTFAKLPKTDSIQFRHLVKQIQNQFDKNHSFALLDLKEVFTEALGENWFNSLPHEHPTDTHNGLALSRNSDGFLKVELKPDQLSMMTELNKWIQTLLAQSLGRRFKIEPNEFELRLSTETEKGTTVDNWHIDGGQITVSLALIDGGTEVLGKSPVFSWLNSEGKFRTPQEWEALCPGCVSFKVPRGTLIIFFGKDITQDFSVFPSIHRTPNYLGKRLVLIGRYLISLFN